MRSSFQLVGLDPAPFQALFDLSDEQLLAHAAQRRFADEHPGFPCRVSLEDARPGEELLLLPFLHQPAASPYRASGPIFVRRGATRRTLPVGTLSGYVTRRLISVRAYDAAHMIVDASVCEGAALAPQIDAFFSRDDIVYLHLHNAKQGCFSCKVERA
jgi:hypothetical protein